MPRSARTELYTLNVLDFALVLVLFIALLGLVFVPAVVDNSADRRAGSGGNEDKIETRLLRHLKGLSGCDDADLFACGSYEPDIRMAKASLVDHRPWIGPNVSTFKPSYLASPEFILCFSITRL